MLCLLNKVLCFLSLIYKISWFFLCFSHTKKASHNWTDLFHRSEALDLIKLPHLCFKIFLNSNTSGPLTALIPWIPKAKPKGIPPGPPRQRVSPVPQGGCVDLEEASTIHEDFGTHVAHGDQLGPALKPGVVLLQDLGERCGVSQSSRQAPPSPPPFRFLGNRPWWELCPYPSVSNWALCHTVHLKEIILVNDVIPAKNNT